MIDDELLASVFRKVLSGPNTYASWDSEGWIIVDGGAEMTPEEMAAVERYAEEQR